MEWKRNVSMIRVFYSIVPQYFFSTIKLYLHVLPVLFTLPFVKVSKNIKFPLTTDIVHGLPTCLWATYVTNMLWKEPFPEVYIYLIIICLGWITKILKILIPVNYRNIFV